MTPRPIITALLSLCLCGNAIAAEQKECPVCYGAGTIIEGDAGRMDCYECGGDGSVDKKPDNVTPKKSDKRGQRLRKLEERIASLERELVAIRELLKSR